jgi:hypothetical protein
MGILTLIGICVRVSESNIDHHFMLVFPQSSEEDITSVSTVGWVVNRRLIVVMGLLV